MVRNSDDADNYDLENLSLVITLLFLQDTSDYNRIYFRFKLTFYQFLLRSINQMHVYKMDLALCITHNDDPVLKASWSESILMKSAENWHTSLILPK